MWSEPSQSRAAEMNSDGGGGRGRDQSFQGPEVSPQKLKINRILPTIFRKGPNLAKKNVSDFQGPNLQGPKVILSITRKVTGFDPLFFFRRGSFSKNIESLKSLTWIDIFWARGNGPPRFLQPCSEPKSGQMKKDNIFCRSKFSQLTFELKNADFCIAQTCSSRQDVLKMFLFLPRRIKLKIWPQFTVIRWHVNKVKLHVTRCLLTR